MLKQDFKNRIAGVLAQAREFPFKKRENSLLSEALFQSMKFMMGFLLSRTIIFSEYAPFGVAFTAAIGGMEGSFAAFLGAFLGYSFMLWQSNGLKYAAACVLCFSAGVIFKQSKPMEYKFFMPLTAAISLATIGMVFLGDGGFHINDFLLYISEIILASGCTWFYRDVFLRPKEEKNELFGKEKMAGVMVLTVTILGSLCGSTLFDLISPARILSVILIMTASYLGGSGTGTAVGVAAGAVMDAASGKGIFFSAAYGLCALVSGTAKGKNKLLFTMLYIMMNAAISLWSVSNPLYISGLYETFIASVLFYMIPMHILLKTKLLFVNGNEVKMSDYSDKFKKYAERRINLAANAFQELYISMTLGFDNLKRHNDEDVAAIFDRVADKICSRCAAKHICWERDYVTTVGALNDASVEMMKRGQASKEDFPPYFASRCLYFENFISATNEALIALFQRRQFKMKLQENKNLIREQYAAVNEILRGVARDVENGIEFHPNYAHQLKEYVRSFCTGTSVTVSTSHSGRMWVEIEGDNVMPILQEKERFQNGLTLILSRRFEAPEQIMTKGKMSIRLIEEEKFKASIGAGIRRRKGESVSGDSGTYFKTEEGMLYLTLSDGMGSGRDAALESAVAVKLVERFLRAGISAKKTARTITPALMLKNGENSYATIDILGVDLFSGKSVCVKYGAAPTYLKNGQAVEKIISKMLPASVKPENLPEAEFTELNLMDESVAVMISDGVTEMQGDSWLIELIKTFEGDDVKKLAGDILNKASQKGEAFDDMTVLVLKLKQR
ncbi:MAG: SpoIIE family protein phosphatase [Clostridiales bacterium]|nr:SpoIIE family protein phosphatase [Clostridiales bacterium]